MVFEKVASTVLNKVLGKYIDGLDQKNLNLGIWGGKYLTPFGFFDRFL
jgi:vacuolar protein sorting-associated protein 13A/C